MRKHVLLHILSESEQSFNSMNRLEMYETISTFNLLFPTVQHTLLLTFYFIYLTIIYKNELTFVWPAKTRERLGDFGNFCFEMSLEV